MTTNNFTLNYNVTGNDRKRLADKMAEILGCEAKYLGVPTFNYVVDYFTIDKSGTVIFDARADSEEVENLIDHTIILREGRILRDAPTEELVAGACTISGPAGLVEAYLAGREILTSHALGGLKSVTFQGALTDPLPVGLEQGRVSLQDYFISLQEAEDQKGNGREEERHAS